MEFDKNRVYTTLNADEVKIGSKVVVADTLTSLKFKVESGEHETELVNVHPENCQYRFEVTPSDDDIDSRNALCYLVSEPEEKKLKLKWTDLKLGDIIQKKSSSGTITREVIGIDYTNESSHIVIYDGHVSDDVLASWKKAEE